MNPSAQEKQNDLTVRACNFELKSLGDDGTFCGYGSVFNEVDFYQEVVVPGAFAKSLKAHKKAGTMPALLWQHDPHEPIGVFTKMIEDEKGLYVEGKLLIKSDVPHADKAYSLLKQGALSGLSIGFMTVNDHYDDKKKIRMLTEVDLWETSLVTFPANSSARITAVKSLGQITVENVHLRKRDIEAALRDAGASISVATYVAAQIGNPALRDEGGAAIITALSNATNILKG